MIFAIKMNFSGRKIHKLLCWCWRNFCVQKSSLSLDFGVEKRRNIPHNTCGGVRGRKENDEETKIKMKIISHNASSIREEILSSIRWLHFLTHSKGQKKSFSIYFSATVNSIHRLLNLSSTKTLSHSLKDVSRRVEKSFIKVNGQLFYDGFCEIAAETCRNQIKAQVKVK